MIDFDFINPTRIIFGKGKESNIAEILMQYGFKNALFVYGKSSIKNNGLYDRIVNKLNEAHITFSELGGISANPDISFVREGVKVAKEKKVDCILAVGGGSVIDVAKAIGVSYYYDGDPLDFTLHKTNPTNTLPVGAILTIASAGSESSDSCVISDSARHIKQGFNSNVIRPLFVIENPELTYGVSRYQTACGVADMMMHTMERYFGNADGDCISDRWALELIKHIYESGKVVIEEPTNYEARANLMLDSTLAHDGITGLGKSYKFVVHPLEHAISGYKSDVAHGAGIAVCYLGWAKYVYKTDPSKFAVLARVLFDINNADDKETAIIGIRSMEAFYKSIGLPTTLKEIGITEKDIPHLVSLASGNGTRVIGRYPQSLDESDIAEVYRLCL